MVTSAVLASVAVAVACGLGLNSDSLLSSLLGFRTVSKSLWLLVVARFNPIPFLATMNTWLLCLFLRKRLRFPDSCILMAEDRSVEVVLLLRVVNRGVRCKMLLMFYSSV